MYDAQGFVIAELCWKWSCNVYVLYTVRYIIISYQRENSFGYSGMNFNVKVVYWTEIKNK